MNVLLSIRPIHTANILCGVKKFEFRRRLFTRKDVRTVLIYCTRPVGMLVGEFDIAGILEADPKTLWEQTRVGAGITKPYFDSYFEGRTTAFAIRVGAIRAYDIPIAPAALIDNFSPPQSYRYVSSRETNTAPHQETATNYALW